MTTNHINMFAKAKEIQEGWEPEVGDRFTTLSQFEHSKRIELFDETWVQIVNQKDYIRSKHWVYLPSIEQMAGMWHKKMEETDHVHEGAFFFQNIMWFITKQIGKYDIDWPESIIVLAFIQHELYGLTWSEEKGEWV